MVLLLRLCEPFMDPASPKVALIDENFLACGSRLLPSDDPKLVSTSDGILSSSTAALSVEQDFNFVTRVFFTCARAVHLGLVSSIRAYQRLLQQLGHMQQMGHEHFGLGITNKLTQDVTLLSPELLTLSVRFAALLAAWTVRSCGGVCRKSEKTRGADGGELQVPLPWPPSQSSLLLPQHMVEDSVEIALFASRFAPEVILVCTLLFSARWHCISCFSQLSPVLTRC